MTDFSIERKFKRLGFDKILGVDEAGRGPLAGPVVACAVCLKSTRFKNRIDDSKKLSSREREDAFLEIIQKSVFSLSVIDEGVIDASNILIATSICMERAILSLLKKLGDKNIFVLVDGNVRLRLGGTPFLNVIKGDAKSKTIACASILAKVSRDRIMFLYDKVWPRYGFLKHKGYPTEFHRKMLKQIGPSPIHRLTFSYV